MPAANLPTPPVAATATTTRSAGVAAWLASLAYDAWRAHGQTIDERDSVGNKTFADGDVATGTDTITITAHGFRQNQQVRMTTTGVLPAGLALATNYFVIVVDANSIKVSAAVNGVAVDITAAAGGGTHTINTAIFGTMPANFAALHADQRDQWTREVQWLLGNPGCDAQQLWRDEAENAVRLGWRYGASIDKTNKLYPYLEYNQFEGQTIATPNIRGFQALPEIEQQRYQFIVAMFLVNRDRLREVTKRLEQNTDDPSLFGTPKPALFSGTALSVQAP